MVFVLSYIGIALVTFASFYLLIPAVTFCSTGFLCYVAALVGLWLIPLFFMDKIKTALTGLIIPGILLALVVLISIFTSPLFMARNYASVLAAPVQTDIAKYTPTIDSVPLMDRSTAELLMSRTMGTLVNEVSQFELDDSTQINYNGRAIRVAPLKYGGLLKWFNNKSRGIPSYITVDMQTQKTEIHAVEGGINYSPSAFLGKDLMRHLRFHDLSAILGDPVFELDEEGNPIWVVPKLEHKVGPFFGSDVQGIYVVDAVTGAIEYYAVGNVPSYIDNVYPASLVIGQYDNFGQFQGGFWNSFLGQKNVRVTTEGYNYIPQNDDIYMYTGVTSVGGDESNIGFIYANLRTKEIQYFEQPGAEEYSAMSSAEGVVQHLGYTSTFPLLLQIEGHPTYCVALKDAGGLVKMYSLVNVEQYQIVVVGDTISQALTKYRTALRENNQTVGGGTVQGNTEITGTISEIRSANVDGTTFLYIQLDERGPHYELNVADNKETVLLNVGDTVTLHILDGTGEKIKEAMLPGSDTIQEVSAPQDHAIEKTPT